MVAPFRNASLLGPKLEIGQHEKLKQQQAKANHDCLNFCEVLQLSTVVGLGLHEAMKFNSKLVMKIHKDFSSASVSQFVNWRLDWERTCSRIWHKQNYCDVLICQSRDQSVQNVLWAVR
jgi:hypothetical protein